MRILMRVHELMTPYSPIFITQEKHYAYTLGCWCCLHPLGEGVDSEEIGGSTPILDIR